MGGQEDMIIDIAVRMSSAADAGSGGFRLERWSGRGPGPGWTRGVQTTAEPPSRARA
ncbi:hypothetical protein [Microbispora sp. GKU 823]|uniref:hypothetical protein n=1 Tax=Microbispora sp. GKU 823 TaxID=1652100 RepID=UPI0035677041